MMAIWSAGRGHDCGPATFDAATALLSSGQTWGGASEKGTEVNWKSADEIADDIMNGEATYQPMSIYGAGWVSWRKRSARGSLRGNRRARVVGKVLAAVDPVAGLATEADTLLTPLVQPFIERHHDPSVLFELTGEVEVG